MAHPPVKQTWFCSGLGLVTALALVAGCGHSTSESQQAVSPAATQSAPAPTLPEEGRAPRFFSKRFHVSVPLPDGKTWKIDDHSQPELVARHEPTASMVALSLTNENEPMSRQKCEDRARDRKLVPADLRTVEDEVRRSPTDFDTRVWVAVEAQGPGKAVVGHVFAFGGYLRKCLFFHYSTSFEAGANERILSARLATAKSRIFQGLTVSSLEQIGREGR